MVMAGEHVGEEFQEGTKHHRDRLIGRSLDWTSRPSTYKEYPSALTIAMPPPTAPSTAFADAVRGRRSVRDFLPRPITADQLSYLLWSSTGIRERRGRHDLRTSPSAGALYPIETYLVVRLVEGIDPGVYHYDVHGHRLELLTSGDHGPEAAAGALDQEMCALAPVTFVWTAMFPRSAWKYGQRAYRYVYLDAGHIAAHLSLAASALGLGSCQIAAAYDDEINALVGVDGKEESVVYMTVVGWPSDTP
jgi:SagB-type dehydrogenase family enzyme